MPVKVVCVTGMHRSGTSLVARVCNILGVDLGGPEHLMEATADNPTGYWEHEEVTWFNERLLGELGGNWKQPPVLDPGWERQPGLDQKRADASTLFQTHFAGVEVVGWKDPRMSFLLPFWRTVVPIDRTVLCIRDPREVAASLAARNSVEPERAARLWLRYTVAAYRSDPDAVIVAYHDFFHDSDAVVALLCNHLELAPPTGEQRETIEAFVAPELRHHVAQRDPPSGSEMALALQVFQSLADRRLDVFEEVAGVLERHWRLRCGDLQKDQLLRERDREVRAVRAELQALRDTSREQARAHDREVGALRTEVRALRASSTRAHALEKRLRQEQLRRERAQRDLRRLRHRRSVRLTLRVASLMRPAFRGWRELRSRAAGVSAKEAPGHQTRPDAATPAKRPTSSPDPATAAAQEALARRLREEVPEPSLTTAPLVSIVILNHSGASHLRRCLPALVSTDYPSLELIVVDNASTDESVDIVKNLDAPFPVKLIENSRNESFSDANNQGVAATNGELLLLLNNDVEPVTRSWLAHLVDALQRREAVAAGARLVYPARPGLDNQGDSTLPDLSLQHRGIHFSLYDGVPRGRNLGAGEDPLGRDALTTREVPGVTAACMLVRRDSFDAVGGLTSGYVYGTEDVDLCLKLRAAGGRIAYAAHAVLWHHEYGTQNALGRERKGHNRALNRQLFIDRWGPQLLREVLQDKITNSRAWSDEPFHVAVTLTNHDVSAGWGDWYTAHELGEALQGLGWQVTYIERHQERWYDLEPSVDAVIVLLDRFDIGRIPPHVITIAWVRNWTERWLSHPWFDDYDVVFASSQSTHELIEKRSSKVATLMPLAANPDRFRPVEPVAELASDAIFVGNYWQKPRTVLDVLPPLARVVDVKLFGKGWEEVPALRHLHRGTLPYERLPEAYSSARIVVDDTASHTKPYGAVNARVFEALATGRLVVSDNPEGVRGVFDDEFPVFGSSDELVAQVKQLLADPARVAELTARYRDAVLSHHTYRHRAEQIRDTLLSWCNATRVGVHIGVPQPERAPRWGDYHFARGLQRQLERKGHPTQVLLLPEWDQAHAARADIALHLFGRSELRTRPSQVNALWIISHPDLVSTQQCESYDVVFSASDRLATRLAEEVSVSVHVLHQATDPDRFSPSAPGPFHTLLFVGNSRGVPRQILDDLLPTVHDLAIYGGGWTDKLVDTRYVRAEHIPNTELANYYASACIVLNDHWPDMRREGIFSNRLYDALAAGAFVISDHVEGIEDEFDGGVVTYRYPDDLRDSIRRYLADEEARREHSAKGRAAVLARHTFAHRVAELLRILEPAADARPSRVQASKPPSAAAPERLV
ncbi:MAG TPA: glycosyltransferase [Egibacteraceae bacterium]|nr:glycosyltransferase [Egibacteraceae bacterium]